MTNEVKALIEEIMNEKNAIKCITSAAVIRHP